jgi:cytochrome P450
MAVASAPALPPGPSESPWLQARRYVWRFPQYTREQHARFGPSYTLRLPGLPASVLTSDRGLIRELVTGDPLVRRHANDILAPVLGGGSVMQLEPAPHLKRRKLLLPSFHGEAIAGYRALMTDLIEADLDRWPAEVKVAERARAITLDVIQHAVLGMPDAAMAGRFAGLLDRLNSPLANFGLFAPSLGRRARWNLLAEPFHRLVDRLNDLLGEHVRATRADPALAGRTDVLALLIRATGEDGHGLSDQDLVDELKTLLAAGHETTATAIAWGTEQLAHHPEAAERVRSGNAAYLTATAKEVLRIRTVAPVSVARTLLEPLGGLPAGAVVLADAFSVHEDPELYPDPHAFRPERFLDGGPDGYAFLPFGGGAHRCLGAALAQMELELALSSITRRFALTPAGPLDTPSRRGPTLVPARGARVRVSPA